MAKPFYDSSWPSECMVGWENWDNLSVWQEGLDQLSNFVFITKKDKLYFPRIFPSKKLANPSQTVTQKIKKVRHTFIYFIIYFWQKDALRLFLNSASMVPNIQNNFLFLNRSELSQWIFVNYRKLKMWKCQIFFTFLSNC